MILRPAFYDVQSGDRRAERIGLGLDPDLPTALVLFGGEGSNAMYSIAELLGNSSLDLQLIMICGRNARLKERLSRLKTRNRLHVEGFTKQIPHFMSLADFFVGKPGPGSITEALHMHLPVVIESNAWTLPQERYNAEWVREHEFGVVLRNFRGIEAAVRDLLSSGKLDRMKQRIGALQNRAVYEVPRVLAGILADAGHAESLQSGGTKPLGNPSSPLRRI
jgi:1,2-diacylglycerol 3-beta-galactosyltransferase